ncbi:GT2 family glycosyltransferase/glycosyltransferase involved in cell wall biosynthesis [Paraburkholderia sp. UCT70]|uniref:glycosyltransferase n=1 Tax=Paraburkholderia sp. UCT70 TaxID=2991068 RepID=UPI003D1C4B98
MNLKGKRLIVVLGMHRSGTSAITRALTVLGVTLGDRLLPPAEGINLKGYFEDIDLNALNIQMLQAIGSEWHCVDPIEASDVENLRNNGYFIRAVNLLRHKTTNASIFGFKDPRVAKLLPFWHQVFVHCGFDIGYIIALRNPLSVAQSLAKRDGFQTEKSYMLWLGHVLASLAHTETHRRVLIDYDNFLDAPQNNLQSIADRLDLRIDPDALRYYLSEFLDKGLRNTVYAANDLAVDQGCPPLLREIYGVLIEVSRNNKQLEDENFHARTALWLDEFNRQKVGLRWIDQLSEKIDTLNRCIATTNEANSGLVKAAQEQDQNVFRKSFDAKWYLETNPDVAAAGHDPYLHYIKDGVTEGRHPSADLVGLIRVALPERLKELNAELNHVKFLAEQQSFQLAEREKEFSEKLQDLKRQHEQQEGEDRRQYAERERTCLADLALARQQLDAQMLVVAQRENAFSQQLQELRQTHDEQKGEQSRQYALREQRHLVQLTFARNQLEARLLELAQRERAFCERLQEIQQAYEQHKDEQRRKHAEAEQLYLAELALARQQVETHLLALAQREEAFSDQLQEMQKAHEQQMEEQARKHAVREQAHLGQLDLARDQVEMRVLELAQRERAFSAQLQEIQQAHNKQKDEQWRQHAEREQLLRADLAAKESELLNLVQSWIETEKTHTFVITQLHRELDAIRATFLWRMTAPLRYLIGFLGQKNLVAEKQRTNWSSPLFSKLPGISRHISEEAVVPRVDEASPMGRRDGWSTTDPMPDNSFVTLVNTANKIVDMPATHPNLVAATLDELLSYHDEFFIHSAYHTLLGRGPETEGFRYYLARLEAGVSKIEILGQLRKSREGKSYPVKVAGLDAAVGKNSRSRWPIVGSWFGESTRKTKIRMNLIENKLRHLEAKMDRRFDHLASSIALIQGEMAVVSNNLVSSSPAEGSHQLDIAVSNAYEVLLKSDFFDPRYYLQMYVDVAAANIDPVQHYLLDGWREGRNPSAKFDTNFYLSTNQDVAASAVNPLLHYIQYGMAEGRASLAINAIKDVRDAICLFNKQDCIPTFDENNPIDIIIPIYNGYDYLQPLFDSIVKNSTIRYRLIVVNDCSPDHRIAKFIELFGISNPSVELIFLENESNLGFVRSVNKAVAYTNNNFVILNTDTEVPPGWLERLMYPIFEMSDVASTTPFTNSGTIFSFPTYLKDNVIFEGLCVEEIDRYFKDVNFEKTHIAIPTGVGFCMGVNKSLVDKIGMFDEVFGKGYGEENDWCQRAISEGYKNVHVTNLFVYHKHGGSFASETKRKLIEENFKILIARHPLYEKHIHAAIGENKLDFLRRLLVLKVLSDSRTSHLILDHSLGGGANQYSEQKISNHLAAGDVVCSVKFDFKQTKQYLIEFRFAEESSIFKSVDIDSLYEFISIFNFKNIFVNSLVSFNEVGRHLDKIASLKKRHGKNVKLTVPMHDFFPVCPSYTLLDETATYCAVPRNLRKCSKCLKESDGDFKTFENSEDIQDWREKWGTVLRLSDEVLCFSNSSKDILLKAYEVPSEKTNIVPHDISGRYGNIYVPRENPSELRVGILGAINEAKGASIVRKLVEDFDQQSCPVKVILIGEISAWFSSPSFEVTGRYNAADLQDIVLQKKIDVFLIPSVWPETFSYTTDEIMQMGYPLIVFDLGAPAERVRNYELGEVVEINELHDVLITHAKKLGIADGTKEVAHARIFEAQDKFAAQDEL